MTEQELVERLPAPVAWMKPPHPEVVEPRFILASERTQEWQKSVFTLPLYPADAIERLVRERDESKAACDSNTALGAEMAEMWKARASSAEAQLAEMREALERLAADATQIMSAHDPRGAELTMSGDEASKRVHLFVADAAPFVSEMPGRIRRVLSKGVRE